MTPASDSCAAGFCFTFDNSVNIDHPKGQFIEAADMINSNPACVVSINRSSLAGALESMCQKNLLRLSYFRLIFRLTQGKQL